MRCVIKFDKDDCYKSADLRELNAVELLTINKALRLLAENPEVHEADRRTAVFIGERIMEGSKHPSSPLKAYDGDKELEDATATADDFYNREGKGRE